MNGYQPPFFNPYGFMGQYQQPQTNVQPSSQVVRVNGENGAKAYPMGANSSALLLDESGLMVWLITTDGASYKTVAAYDIIPHKAEPPVDYSDLETRIKRLEDMVGGKRNGTSGNPSAVSKKSNESNGSAD